jgi:cytochrome c
MDGFEVNKILGAILGTALLVMALRNFGDAFFKKEPLEKNAYPVAVAASASGPGGTAPAALDIPKLLAEARPQHGEQISEKCLACHTIAKGAPNATGPNLWGVVGGPTAHLGDAFPYSSAMKKFGGTWTYDRLFAFLENPQGYISGTKMTFAGLSKPTDRADIIAYLRTQSDNPPPLPTPTAAAPAANPPAAESSAGPAPGGATAPATSSPVTAAPATGTPMTASPGGPAATSSPAGQPSGAQAIGQPAPSGTGAPAASPNPAGAAPAGNAPATDGKPPAQKKHAPAVGN